MGSVVTFQRNGLSAWHVRLMAQQLSHVRITASRADDGSLFAIIDDDNGLPLEVCLSEGLFIAGRGGQSFAKTPRFEDIIVALYLEINDCLLIGSDEPQ